MTPFVYPLGVCFTLIKYTLEGYLSRGATRQVYYAILDKFTLHIYNSKYTKFTWQERLYDFAEIPQIYANHQHAAFSDYDLLFFAISDYHGRIAACHKWKFYRLFSDVHSGHVLRSSLVWLFLSHWRHVRMFCSIF